MILDAPSDIAIRVTGAIRQAAKVTGAGFDYLLKTALRESRFDPNAKAPTSSAAGLFQFIDQTWLATLKQAGPKLGYSQYAAAIVQNPSGKFEVPDPTMRAQIMALRFDPNANALMAGAFTEQNAADLTAALGRKPTDGELYIAHFLGSAGAIKLITQAAQAPTSTAADAFPAAARANRPIFYNRDGTARTAAQVYAALIAQHDRTQVAAVPPIASVLATNTTVPVGPPTAIAPVTPVAKSPLTPTEAEPVNPYAGEKGPIFLALFRNQRTEPVSPAVSALWGAKPAPEAPPAPTDSVADTTVTQAPAPAAPPEPAKAAAPFEFLRVAPPKPRDPV